MPKQKITKDMVVEAAFQLARAEGAEQITVKKIAQRLGCSVQPIYSYCTNMEGLRDDVADRARAFIREYTAARIDGNDLFRSTGRAYLQLAKEEPHVLKLFLFQQRRGISSLDEFYRREASGDADLQIAETLGLSIEQARELHLDMLLYTVGIGAVFSVSKPGIPAEEIYQRQERAYRAFLAAAQEDQKSA